jgi:Phage integrase family
MPSARACSFATSPRPRRRHRRGRPRRPSSSGGHPRICAGSSTSPSTTPLVRSMPLPVSPGCGAARSARCGGATSTSTLAGLLHVRRQLNVVCGQPGGALPSRRRSAVNWEQRVAIGAGWIDTGLVFTRPTGEPVNSEAPAKMFDHAVKRSGLRRVRFHDLRHSHASHPVAAGTCRFRRSRDVSAMRRSPSHSATTPTWATTPPQRLRRRSRRCSTGLDG